MQHGRAFGVALCLALAACSAPGGDPLGTNQVSSGIGVQAPPAVTAPRQYRVKVFVRGNAKRYNPDPIVWQGQFLYVAYQNATGPKGAGGDSTIVQYSRRGKIMKSVDVRGRCDGMRWNPYQSLMWITVNEDANSSMYTWDPTSGALKHYSFSSAQHGGGYDDLAFSNGQAFIAASNPTLIGGINKGPAVVGVTLQGNTAEVTPVLMGDSKAKDILTGKTVTLNLTDPDSMTVAQNGDVLLVSQADAEIVLLHNVGKGSQSVSRLDVGTQIDDTVYATKRSGVFYVADSKKNVIYSIRAQVTSGTLFTEAPSDSRVAGFVGTIDQSTGTITPVITGFDSPTGLVFVAGGQQR